MRLAHTTRRAIRPGTNLFIKLPNGRSYRPLRAATTRLDGSWTVERSGRADALRRARASRRLRGREDLVRGERLGGGHAPEAISERALALGQEGGPHLEDRVGEAELEDRPRDRREGGLTPGLDALPDLAPVADGEPPHVLRARGGELDAAVHPERAQAPRVRLPRRDSLRREREREPGVRVQRRVVPGVAADRLPARPGALAHDVLEHGVDARRAPPEPQRDVEDVHAEVGHDAELAAELRLALPVDRLAAVEVAGVQERVLGLDHLAERTRADGLVGELRAREVRHLARAAGEDARLRLERVHDAPRRRDDDPERLLAQEVLPGLDRLEVELLVEGVRDREVEDVEVGILEQRAAVAG